MALNKSKGNMYPFVTHTWNTIKGKCPHNCSYCYMKRFGKQKPIRFTSGELKTDLGEGNFIFVGSSCDMWAKDINSKWILTTLIHCKRFKNKYLFQSKNPAKFVDFTSQFPPNTILGTTIESNRWQSQMGNSPLPFDRTMAMKKVSFFFKTMVTIEPIMDFDTHDFVKLIKICNPEWVNIGADSQNSGLPEPSVDKINELIRNLRAEGLEVKLKDNLKRLMK